LEERVLSSEARPTDGISCLLAPFFLTYLLRRFIPTITNQLVTDFISLPSSLGWKKTILLGKKFSFFTLTNCKDLFQSTFFKTLCVLERKQSWSELMKYFIAGIHLERILLDLQIRYQWFCNFTFTDIWSIVRWQFLYKSSAPSERILARKYCITFTYFMIIFMSESMQKYSGKSK